MFRRFTDHPASVNETYFQHMGMAFGFVVALPAEGGFAVEPVLIYTTDGFKPKDWNDLAGATVGYVDGAMTAAI